MSSTYIEKLKDPRWQKSRLFILERDEWACRSCSANNKTLHVHHTYYEHGKDPWDYPAPSLITLCEECHEEEKGARGYEEEALLSLLRRRGYLSGDINWITVDIYERDLESICKFFKGRFEIENKHA